MQHWGCRCPPQNRRILAQAGASELQIQIRHLTQEDIEAIVRLHQAAAPIDQAARARDAASLRRWLPRRAQADEQCLVAEAGGLFVGYAVRSLIAGTDQCLVDGLVHPAFRRRGIGRQLLQRIVEDARLAGARSLDLRARDDDTTAIAFAEATGFRLERRWLRMWLEPLRVPHRAFPSGYSWRHFIPHTDEAAYAQIVTETFREHWGVGPTSIERVNALVNRPEFEPTNILFATCQREIVGVCMVRFLERAVDGCTYKTAHIGPIGVRAAHRGRGLGRALLSLCLQRCRRRFVEAAELDVDEHNAPAIRIYRSLGFRTLHRILWYRRDLTASPSG